MTISRNKAKQPKQIDLVLPKHPATARRESDESAQPRGINLAKSVKNSIT